MKTEYGLCDFPGVVSLVACARDVGGVYGLFPPFFVRVCVFIGRVAWWPVCGVWFGVLYSARCVGTLVWLLANVDFVSG